MAHLSFFVSLLPFFFFLTLSLPPLSHPSSRQRLTRQDGALVQFKTKKTTQLKKLMKAYCERMNRESEKKKSIEGERDVADSFFLWGLEGDVRFCAQLAWSPRPTCLCACRRNGRARDTETRRFIRCRRRRREEAFDRQSLTPFPRPPFGLPSSTSLWPPFLDLH